MIIVSIHFAPDGAFIRSNAPVSMDGREINLKKNAANLEACGIFI